ncbi:MAG: AmmeMemoRadiSam system protein B [Planctomycetaceae bacterium]|nr:AmmeMemoRadiSam system protein B [Planctomycetaceae bacterium]
MPGSTVAACPELTDLLCLHMRSLQRDSAAHEMEHGIEVLLPLIHRLSPETRVTGIVIGQADLEQCAQLAEGLAAALREYNRPVLLLISSDMNHFATDTENRRLDAMALERFDALDPDGLYRVCRQNRISMCGLLPAVIVFKTLQQLKQLDRCVPVGYGTSADVSGQTDRVVGYAGRLLC